MADRVGLAPYHSSDVLKRHFELTQLLYDAPLSHQERIAEELVSIAVDARSEFKRLYPGERLPRHRGYYRLAVNYERARRYEDAIVMCRNAIEQEWSGDWEKRIERCERKLAKIVDSP